MSADYVDMIPRCRFSRDVLSCPLTLLWCFPALCDDMNAYRGGKVTEGVAVVCGRSPDQT